LLISHRPAGDLAVPGRDPMLPLTTLPLRAKTFVHW
jgi:hypothetical protein